MAGKLNLPNFNSTDFPLAVKSQIESLPFNEQQAEQLKYHQFVAKEFFTRSDARGLLICHSMGQGKTRLAVSIALHFREYEPERRVILLSAKSLAENFKKEVRRTLEETKANSSALEETKANSSALEETKANSRTLEETKANSNALEETKANSRTLEETKANSSALEETKANSSALEETKQDSDTFIDKNFRFVSLNSSNMFSKLSKLDRDEEQLALEEKFGAIIDEAKILEGSLLIVDEAHNLFNSITNGAKNAVSLYDTIMKTNMKLIFLSGTPMINDPFELVPCFNMLRGQMRMTVSDKKKKIGDPVTLFSEDVEEFEYWFVDQENHTIKNKDRFVNRIYGLSSYYGDLYFEDSKDKPGFPKELDNIIERVNMSQTQFARYITARIAELDESKNVYRAKASRFSAAKGSTSTYRVKSRQISNYCIPEYALGSARGNKSREKFINKITHEDLINLEEFSPKMNRIIQNIKKHKGQRGMVYSQFVSGEGIGIFELVLQALGWQRYGEEKELEMYDLKNKKGDSPIFAVLSGNIDPEERAAIINKFNESAEKPTIDLLLLSGAVAEGIDLKRIRHVHIMEPFWNYARINQVKTRAIRYNSHIDLPANEQNVQVYIYLSDYPLGYPKKKITEPTTDNDLYQSSIENMKLIDTFMTALAESSIDCALHHAKLPEKVRDQIRCKLCAPTGMKLFHELLNIDMELPNPCNPFVENKKSVETFSYNGTEYKYSNDGKVYSFNSRLKGWSPMPRNDPAYASVHAAIKDKLDK